MNDDNLADEELLKLSIDKPSVFEVLVGRYRDAFLRKAETIVFSREEAEDIVQEVFTKIYLNASRFQTVPGASFKSWAYKILMNTTFTHYKKMRKSGKPVLSLDDELSEFISDTEQKESFKNDERYNYVASILVRMPKHLSRILTLHFLEDKPQKEIAELEGLSIPAVKTRIHRAKKEFKKIESEILP